MSARRIGLALVALTMAGTGSYVFVYLYRWEWNRALVSAALFLAAEVALVGWRLADRVANLDRRIDSLTADRQALTLRRIQDTAPAQRVGFEWLRPQGTSVFVPVLMGAGVVLSGLAWVVEKLARSTAQPVAERGLVAQLAPLAVPAHGFLEREPDPLALIRQPLTGGPR